MRVVLLHAPPWPLAGPRQSSSHEKHNAPAPPGNADAVLNDADLLTIPFGLVTLAAHAQRAGHDVDLYNVANFDWCDVETLIRHRSAALFGMSCFTVNRRGVAALARLIREAHPDAHIVVGGPHATALPIETLESCVEVDTVVVGEGEATFLELLQRIEAGETTNGVPGTAYRSARGVEHGPPRPRIQNLDSLASPLDYCCIDTLVTARGCPWKCTFCASKTLWHRKVTSYSVEYVLDMLQSAVSAHGLHALAIKDDTFSANPERALALCRGIRQRGLNLLWSCDTRVDCLDEELLHAMRGAGCQRISMGVESASPQILQNIKKGTTPEQILEATRMAQRLGFEVRYYLIVGNRGETEETFRQTLEFVRQARPSSTVLLPLSVYPGAEEFELRHGRQDGSTAEQLLAELADSPLEAAAPEERRRIEELWRSYEQRHGFREYSVEECKGALELLPGLHAAHLDLGGAYYRAGDTGRAEHHVRKAMELGYPVIGLALNYLACLAAHRGDYSSAETCLHRAFQTDALALVARNLQLLHQWTRDGGPDSGRQLRLEAHNRFHAARKWPKKQPEKPAPITLDSRVTLGRVKAPGDQEPTRSPAR